MRERADKLASKITINRPDDRSTDVPLRAPARSGNETRGRFLLRDRADVPGDGIDGESKLSVEKSIYRGRVTISTENLGSNRTVAPSVARWQHGRGECILSLSSFRVI